MQKFKQIGQFYPSTLTLSNLRTTFESIANLNQILYKQLPEYLVPFCHVGAIDEAKNILVIFVNNQQVLHIIKNMSDTILHAFYIAHYSFDKILIRVSVSNSSTPKIKRPPLTQKVKEKLCELAIAIGKPELIIDDPSDTEDKDEIKL